MNSQQLHQEQGMRLQQRLNPRQLMLGRVLGMSEPEVNELVNAQLDDNPALEKADTPDTGADETFGETAEELQRADYASDDDIMPTTAPRRDFGGWGHSYDPDNEDQESMAATLTRRVAVQTLDPTTAAIARFIIGNLEPSGYLERPLTALANDYALAENAAVPDIQQMRRAFEAVRALDPAGIGAVDLRDCLLLQLRRMPRNLDVLVARQMIDEYFDLFSKLHFDSIRSRMGVDADSIRRAVALVKTLNPKPGSMLGGESARQAQISPDFAVDYDHATGEFTVTLLNRIPELEVSQTFRAESEQAMGTNTRGRDEAMAFVNRKYEDAQAFISLMKMRGDTLSRVMKAIVSLQSDFFASGNPSDIRPMILKDVSARAGDMDLSVISRATSGKYVITSHGMYPLKKFFNERPQEDTDASTHAVLETLKGVIAAENPAHPLSDQALTEAMAQKGMPVARRTVTKYRERLGIPVARLRKKF